VTLDSLYELGLGHHGEDSKRTFPLSARGQFLGAAKKSAGYRVGMDHVRALIVARLEQTGLHMTQVSKAIGKSHSYLQQFLRRGIPAVLPEDVREKLATELGVTPDALRAQLPGKGGPKAAAPDAVAGTETERQLLTSFRALDPAAQAQAIKIVRSLA
jgi:lambda repressor-like predicted transcriptional regulator